MNKTTIASVCIIALSFIIGIVLYNNMPATMASHWNAAGEVNGYMPRFWGLFLLPIISIAIFILLRFIPMLDPLKKNIASFRKHYDRFILILVAFMLCIHIMTLIWNFGYTFNMMFVLTPLFAILFYYAGVLMENAKRNWFIGIRTPWTLSSDKVWDKTHKLGSKLFKIAGVMSLFGMILPKYAIIFIIVPVIAASIWLTIYSYVEYRKEKKK